MNTLLLALVISPLALFAHSPPAPITQGSGRVLVLEVTIPASKEDVWHAFTTSEGLSTWLTPGAVVDLRSGGEWTAHFPGGHTGGGAIVSFVAMRGMALR